MRVDHALPKMFPCHVCMHALEPIRSPLMRVRQAHAILYATTDLNTLLHTYMHTYTLPTAYTHSNTRITHKAYRVPWSCKSTCTLSPTLAHPHTPQYMTTVTTPLLSISALFVESLN